MQRDRKAYLGAVHSIKTTLHRFFTMMVRMHRILHLNQEMMQQRKGKTPFCFIDDRTKRNTKVTYMHTQRDQYGFVKGSQWLSVEEHKNFERIYQPIANRRLQKWRQMISENKGEWPARSSKREFSCMSYDNHCRLIITIT